MIVSHNFHDIENELEKFHPHKADFISFFINTVTYYY
jgi:hypothetical protein